MGHRLRISYSLGIITVKDKPRDRPINADFGFSRGVVTLDANLSEFSISIELFWRRLLMLLFQK